MSSQGRAVAMRILDVFEVAEVEVWPLWELQSTPPKRTDKDQFTRAMKTLDATEYSAYLQSLRFRRGSTSLRPTDTTLWTLKHVPSADTQISVLRDAQKPSLVSLLSPANAGRLPTGFGVCL